MAYHKACLAVDARSHGLCEGATPACPDGMHRGSEHHHRRTRAQGGPDTADNLLLLCLDAHAWVHDHPAESYENGLLLRTMAERGSDLDG